MLRTSRRELFKALLAGTVVSPLPALTRKSENCASIDFPSQWARGTEGQRNADLGDGTYLNPIIPGDHPDPTILKDGENYYMTFSSFYSYPALVIWHSKDLVNWVPLGPSLHKALGEIWAADLCKHDDRYFIYFPANPEGTGWSIFVIWSDDIRGPWSAPIDLNIAGCIDPGHVVGEDGRRYLFVNGIRKVRLADDGLATVGPLGEAYSPWRYPDHWVTENFAPEGPKLLRRGEWFYLVTAVGGTAGPPTGHMVIAARAKSIHGPWEHCPHNPLVRTLDASEPWWSRGHATLVEGPSGDWWMVYHAYENGFRTLGRQTLLEPIEWTKDGWFHARGGDLSRPLAKPVTGEAGPMGFALSDDFSTNKFGVQWSFHDPGQGETDRIKFGEKTLLLAGAGTSPADSSPLTCNVGDRSYQIELSFELIGNAEGGLLLFYNHKAFVGLGFTHDEIRTFQYAQEQTWARRKAYARSMRIRLTNDANIVTYHYSHDEGRSWTLHDTRMEVSGLHHNAFGQFLSLKVGIYSAGEGIVRLQNFTYRALQQWRSS
ncbi:MAG: family 43 glycosylhydrolase [Pseudoxanthomonas sp.]